LASKHSVDFCEKSQKENGAQCERVLTFRVIKIELTSLNA
jgi:hypothetical protein